MDGEKRQAAFEDLRWRPPSFALARCGGAVLVGRAGAVRALIESGAIGAELGLSLVVWPGEAASEAEVELAAA
jgi:hypothetical protein